MGLVDNVPMIDEPWWMSWRVVICMLLVCGCSAPNPRSCADGTCTDPAFPFCDVDGAFGDTVQTCIAVDCTPGQVDACRGDQAIRCNDTGTDYELVECMVGCDVNVGGCKGCDTDDQCSAPTPVCDPTTKMCRGCVLDDDCASQVCDVDTGLCLTESQVVYASPLGGDGDPCTQTLPCSLSHAVSVAAVSLSRSTIRLLPGGYTTPLTINGAAITLVGVGATHQASTGTDSIKIGNGANVTIRGLELDLVHNLTCDAGAQGTAALSLRQLTATTVPDANIDLTNCDLTVRDTTLNLSDNSNLSVTGPASLDAERVHLRGTATPRLVTIGSGPRATARIVNSLLDNVAVLFSPTDNTSRLTLAFNTVFINGTFSFVVACNNTPNSTTAIENNVLFKIGNLGTQDAISGNNCTANHNVLSPQGTVISGNILMDPMLVDPANHDFHLQAGSPAIDAAVPSAGLDPTVDLDGVSRPQGAKDIGAFERP